MMLLDGKRRISEERKARLRMKNLLYRIPEETRKEYLKYRIQWFFRLTPAEHAELQKYLDTTPQIDKYNAEHDRIKWFLKLTPEEVETIYAEMDEKFSELSKTQQRKARRIANQTKKKNLRI